tara:strand:- start:415 stop:1218 length:804 start_codon:yes stop_codon:yes gene_type:complete
MNNLIYQYYDGPSWPGTEYCVEVTKAYAKRIGADHVFELNPRWRTNLGKYSPHYGQFKLVYHEPFEKYDNILFTDSDVFAVEGLNENVFDNVKGKDIGICREDFQPESRAKTRGGAINGEWDEKWVQAIERKWGVKMPRTESGLPKVYNSGVVLYSREGIMKMRKNFIDFNEFVNFVARAGIPAFYGSDQSYIHAMLEVAKLNYVEMDSGWNSFVHFLSGTKGDNRPVNDLRTKDTKFVHVQLTAADHFSAERLWKIVNLPVEEWGR